MQNDKKTQSLLDTVIAIDDEVFQQIAAYAGEQKLQLNALMASVDIHNRTLTTGQKD